MLYNIENLGQVFTPIDIVSEMLSLCKNNGRFLEPSCGNGAFFNQIPHCIGIEYDSAICPKEALNIDFFYCCPVKLKTAQFVAPKPSKYGHRGIFL